MNLKIRIQHALGYCDIHIADNPCPHGSTELKQYQKDQIDSMARVLIEVEKLACIQGAEFANNCLYSNCPTGNVSAWDMLKGVQKTQEQLEAFITELKKPGDTHLEAYGHSFEQRRNREYAECAHCGRPV